MISAIYLQANLSPRLFNQHRRSDLNNIVIYVINLIILIILIIKKQSVLQSVAFYHI